MKSDLETARGILEAGGFTCVLYRDGIVHTATARGVKPLLDLLDGGTALRGFSAADKVVGKATAFLYCLLGVEAVYAHVMSRGAAEVLRSHGIQTQISREVDGIINRQGTGPCPFEAAVWEIHDPQQALEAIRAKYLEMTQKSSR